MWSLRSLFLVSFSVRRYEHATFSFRLLFCFSVLEARSLLSCSFSQWSLSWAFLSASSLQLSLILDRPHFCRKGSDTRGHITACVVRKYRELEKKVLYATMTGTFSEGLSVPPNPKNGKTMQNLRHFSLASFTPYPQVVLEFVLSGIPLKFHRFRANIWNFRWGSGLKILMCNSDAILHDYRRII